MPGGDRTGPLGLGPRTGRAAGFCSGYIFPGYMSPVPRFRRGFVRGLGRGFGRGYWHQGRGFWWYNNINPYIRQQDYNIGLSQQPTKEEEKVYFENMVKELEDEIKYIKSRIQDLSKEKKESP